MTEELFKADAAAARARNIETAEKHALYQAKLRKAEADFTPRAVVRAILLWYFEHIIRVIAHRELDEHGVFRETGDLLLVLQGQAARGAANLVLSRPTPVLRILDVCAGAGVWASEIRRLFAILGIAVHITAVELHEEREREYLPRHADEVVFDDWRTFAKRCKAEGRWFDLAIGNPGFIQARALEVGGKLDPDTSMPALLMDIAGAVMLYMTMQGWTKTEAGACVRERYPMAFAVDIPGSVNHRTGLNPKGKRWSADDKAYSTSMWLGKIAGPHVGLTVGGMLKPMDGRSWKEGLRPGAEPLEWLRAEGIPYLEAAEDVLDVLDVPVDDDGCELEIK